jgi:aminoglycoside phosphotransferase (APT) family kinase protein
VTGDAGREAERLEAFVDGLGIGAGEMTAEAIGDGHSNLTFLLRRGADRFVLRTPPRGKIAPSTHDVLREARLLQALGRLGSVKVPEVLLVCDDESVLGRPFYVMSHVDGLVLGEAMPAAYAGPGDAGAIAGEFVEALATIHSLDPADPALAGFGRPDGYLERQLRRFRSLLEEGATRALPDLDAVADWLEANRPRSARHTLVHGDFRLGNVMFDRRAPRLAAVLDWEMATIGDPLADLGYATMAWAQPGDAPNPMLDLSPLTRGPGFPSRDELVARYVERVGRPADDLPWYRVLAAWKAAIFLEGSYGRHLEGDSDDPYFAVLGAGVPALAAQALRWTQVS